MSFIILYYFHAKRRKQVPLFLDNINFFFLKKKKRGREREESRFVFLVSFMHIKKKLVLLHPHNMGTTPSHMRVGPSVWAPPSCEGVLCPYCAGVVQQSNPRKKIWKMLDLQHQYNNCTTIPHMRVGPTYWGPPSCEGLLCSCCIGVVQESNPKKY
jgi:hypothetical protein